MAIERIFLGWEAPALVSAARYLERQVLPEGSGRIEGRTAGDLPECDLSRFTVVVPGARAGRKLEQILTDHAHANGWVLTPPRIVTAGQLPEQLYTPKRPFASDLMQEWAWVEALRARPEAAASVFPHLPADDAFLDKLELGRLLKRLHVELAADGLDFPHVLQTLSDARAVDALELERARWRALSEIQATYLSILDRLELWDRQTARLKAIEWHECRATQPIVLLGVADLNQAVRRMLDQVEQPITALVFAPEELASRFDEHGCVVPEAWQQVAMELPDECLCIADDPADQARRVVACVAEWARKRGPDEIVVGAPDERLAPLLQRSLEDAGARARWGVGRDAAGSGPVRLLTALADYLASKRFGEFAVLIRHPDIEAYLTTTWFDHLPDTRETEGRSTGTSRRADDIRDLLSQCDAYRATYLQAALGEWLGEPHEYGVVRWAHEEIERLLQPLAGEPHARLDLREIPEKLATVLARIYQARTLRVDDAGDHEYREAAQAIRQVLNDIASLPGQVLVRATVVEALHLIVDRVTGIPLAPPADPEAVEILGWLELPLDPAPALIVTSFNEGIVPTSTGGDMFLPNSLRRRLRLLDNQRRFARDAYAVKCLVESKEDVRLLIARRDDEGDPLTPSRLALLEEPSVVARRVRSFLEARDEAVGDEARAVPGPQPPDSTTNRFLVPKPIVSEPITRISVTALRTYLMCPYRFYLRHVLQLESITDEVQELDPSAFGTLIHEVLKQFGQSPLRHETRADVIGNFLRDALEEYVGRTFGQRRLPAVQLQIGQVRRRLQAFAQWQAQWAAQGWRIAHVEHAATWDMRDAVENGVTATLSGKIDRIDVHETTGAWMVFDYKTSDSAKSPEKAHRKGSVENGTRVKTWIDLQLPVYRRMVTALGAADEVGLGYILLPKDCTQVGESLAEWTREELDDAWDVVRETTRRILRCEFWPPTLEPPQYADDFTWICQDQVFHRELEA